MAASRHGMVVRSWCEPDGRWVAAAEAVPEGVARAAVARGDLPDTNAARAAQAGDSWPVETAIADDEATAVLEAVRRLLARLGPSEPAGKR